MGYVFVMSPCGNCHKPMSYHPHKVPSLRINGHREPICKGCIETANPIRIAGGLDPIEILPGAYEGCEETEL